MKIKNGFTLIELLIVVGVLALLLGLLGPAILKSLKTAIRTRQNTEQKLLAASIIEYWHDNKAWPIGDINPYTTPQFRDPDTGKFEGLMVFSGRVWSDPPNDEPIPLPNSRVFDELYRAEFNSVSGIKTYFELNNHITNADQTGSYGPMFPRFAEARLRDVLDNGKANHKSKHPIFCYWATIFKCPKCEAYYGMNAGRCDNREGNGQISACSYYVQNGFDYTFQAKDKSNNAKRALFPYKVTIDLYNETAFVTKDY